MCWESSVVFTRTLRLWVYRHDYKRYLLVLEELKWVYWLYWKNISSFIHERWLKNIYFINGTILHPSLNPHSVYFEVSSSFCGQSFLPPGYGHRLSSFHTLSVLTFWIRSPPQHTQTTCGHQCGQLSKLQCSLERKAKSCSSSSVAHKLPFISLGRSLLKKTFSFSYV